MTIAEPYIGEQDPTFTGPSDLRVVRTIPFRHPLDLLVKWRTRFRSNNSPGSPTDHTSTASNPVTAHPPRPARVPKFLLSPFEFPDHEWGWYYPAIRTLARMLRAERFPVILSTAPPWTSHLIARHIKNTQRIHWIADFRDSWTSDTWHSVPRWHKYLARKLEAGCVRDADLVLCVTNGIRDQFVRRFRGMDASKFVTLTNGFDGVSTAAHKIERTKPITFLHLGELYAGRRIDALCQAVQDLLRRGRLKIGDVKLLFVGPSDSTIIEAATRIAPELIQNNVLEFRPRVNFLEGQQILKSADVLLVIQGNHGGVSAKFFEYLQTGKPVFAIAREGDLTQIISDTHCGVWARYDDSAEIAEKFLAALDLPDRSAEEIDRVAGSYHFRFLAKRLAGMIQTVANKPAEEGVSATGSG